VLCFPALYEILQLYCTISNPQHGIFTFVIVHVRYRPLIGNEFETVSREQGCGVGVVKRRRFLGGVGVGFLTTLGVGVGFFCPTPDVQLGHFLHYTPKL